MSATDRTEDRERPLERSERRMIALLGLPTLALALAITTLTTYGPVAARSYVDSNLVIGVIIGGEGIVALWLPLLVGTWSDRLRTRIGGRLPFLIAGSPVVVVGLIAVGVAASVVPLAAGALVFFVGYFLAYEPYRALYPDLVADDIAGRAQGTQGLWRGIGTGIALLSGGALLAVGALAPFAVSATIYLLATSAFVIVVVRRGAPDEPDQDSRSPKDAIKHLVRLVRGSKPLQAFLVANALWELALGALKTFVVLYVSEGLGYSRSMAGLIIGGVAVFVLLAGLACGKLGDRFGKVRVMQVAVLLFGLGLLLPGFSASKPLIVIAIPFVAAGGGAIMSLPFALIIPLMPQDEHGALSGYYSFSRGLGVWLGPALAGVAVTVLKGPFDATKGYQAMWLVCSAAALLSLLPLRSLRSHAD